MENERGTEGLVAVDWGDMANQILRGMAAYKHFEILQQRELDLQRRFGKFRLKKLEYDALFYAKKVAQDNQI